MKNKYKYIFIVFVIIIINILLFDHLFGMFVMSAAKCQTVGAILSLCQRDTVLLRCEL